MPLVVQYITARDDHATLERMSRMPTGNEKKLQILFAPLFEHTFLPVAKWPDLLPDQQNAPPFGDWWGQV